MQSKSSRISIGDAIAFADVPFANAEFVAVPELNTIPLPTAISFEIAAAVLLQGLTAHYLTHDSFNVKQGDTVLIQAASGGVGQFLTQICKMKGAKVIGLTRTKNKLQTILNNKADYAIKLDQNWLAKILELTNNKGVDVVFDSVGSTLEDSFVVTKEKGTAVFYGMSGGDPAFINPRMLMDTSKTLTGGDLWSYLTSKEERIRRANQLFEWIISGKITLSDPVKFKLSEGKKAHEFLENGKSSGKVLLIPDEVKLS